MNFAHVEIVDQSASDGPILPRRVLVNGTDVGMVKEDGVTIHVGDSGSPTTVTLVLLPGRVTIRTGDI